MFEDKKDKLQFEKEFCLTNHQVWVNKAHDLRNSAYGLFKLYENEQICVFDDTVTKVFEDTYVARTAKPQRMLWAYAFENLLKVIIMLNLVIEDEITEVPFDEIDDHDLSRLAAKAKIVLTSEEKEYISVITKCSIWAGRYPIPKKSHDLPRARETLNTREELLERSKKQFDKYLNGKIKSFTEESDILNTGISQVEVDIYISLFDRLVKKYEKLIELINAIEVE